MGEREQLLRNGGADGADEAFLRIVEPQLDIIK
jgi:hypothetical protein